MTKKSKYSKCISYKLLHGKHAKGVKEWEKKYGEKAWQKEFKKAIQLCAKKVGRVI
jgi:hypothetical protein